MLGWRDYPSSHLMHADCAAEPLALSLWLERPSFLFELNLVGKSAVWSAIFCTAIYTHGQGSRAVEGCRHALPFFFSGNRAHFYFLSISDSRGGSGSYAMPRLQRKSRAHGWWVKLCSLCGAIYEPNKLWKRLWLLHAGPLQWRPEILKLDTPIFEGGKSPRCTKQFSFAKELISPLF